MAMIDPPIDELVKKAGSKYGLCTVVSKRAKEIAVSQKEFFDDNYSIKPLEVATFELADDKYFIKKK